MIQDNKKAFRDGVRDGMPIALGYLAVSFTLGFAAKKAGLNPFQGFLASLLNNASAGEYAGFLQIQEAAPYITMALMTLIANARYFLLSCALSQKFSPGTPLLHRLFVGFDVTDEIFSISIARPGQLNPYYNYGAMSLALPGWSVGTALGIMVGNVLPDRLVSALSVALYGMFLAAVIPAAKKDKVVGLLVGISFALSYGFYKLPYLSKMSEGTRTIVLTILIAGAAAIIHPIDVKDEDPQVADNSAATVPEKEV